MNILFLKRRLQKIDRLYVQLLSLDNFYPSYGLAPNKIIKNRHAHLLHLQRKSSNDLSNLFGCGSILSFIPFTKSCQFRIEFASQLKEVEHALYLHLKQYHELHCHDPQNPVNIKIAGYLKRYFPMAIKTLLLVILSLGLLITSLTLLGALAEDNSVTSTLLAICAGKFLIGAFTFFASKLPLLVLAKCAVITSWFSALTIKELVRPGNFWQIFTLKQEDVLFHRQRSFHAITRTTIPFFGNTLSSLKKWRLALNPFFLIIMGVNLARATFFSLVDRLPFNPKLINKPSPICYRVLKGMLSIIVEINVIPLRILQVIAHLPFDLGKEIVTTYFSNTNKTSNQAKAANNRSIMSNPISATKNRAAEPKNSASYITNKLKFATEQKTN